MRIKRTQRFKPNPNIEFYLDKKIMNKILKVLKDNLRGRTIQNIIDKTGLSRGTIKTYLVHLAYLDKVIELCYGRNTKVYYYKPTFKLK